MCRIEDHYKTILKKNREIRVLSSVSMLLEWDQETFMPKGGISLRSEQIALLSSIIHKEKTSNAYQKLLSHVIDIKTGKVLPKNLNTHQKTNLKEWRKDFLRETKLDNDFVTTLAKTTSQATSVWAEAKRNNSFDTFLPHLEKIIPLIQHKAALIGWKHHPYDALLDLYEVGVTTQDLDTLFAQLKPFLIDLTRKLTLNQTPTPEFLSNSYPEEKQTQFNQFLLKKMGVSPKYSRLDFAEHPFCLGMHPQDVRLTTHHFKENFFKSIAAVLHEGGHALYELGLPPEEFGSPLGDCCSMGVHESQSRWWETFIGQSYPFWQFAFPHLQETFPEQLHAVTLEHFYKAINRVQPSLIRIFADEVTYILHIILRYEIEKEFLENTLAPKDLPNVWNKKMKDFFGIIPSTHSEGCLQDIHWACGLFGYFPTYALGNIYSGQIFQTFKNNFPDWESLLASGDFKFIRCFLGENIHRHGRAFSPLKLIENVTGLSVSPKPYMTYLENKYTR